MKKKILFILVIFSILFIPRIVCATSSADKIHFIKNESGTGDAIVIESNGHFGLVDTMKAGPNTPLSAYGNFLSDATDNGTKVYNYLKALGCTQLDFLIITHNHYDHNGGITELQELVNENTIVFYKEDIVVSDDYEEDLNMMNHITYLTQRNYLDTNNAIKCDVLKCNVSNISNNFINNIVRGSDNEIDYVTNLDENIHFDFGDFSFKLYNLYTLSKHNENLNSIVTLITHKTSGKKTLLLGDIESGRSDYDYDYSDDVEHLIDNPTETTETYNSLGVDGQLALIINQVDIVKAADSASEKANSYYSFKRYLPHYMIVTDTYTEDNNGINIPRSAVAQAVEYERAFFTSTYYTKQSDGAITFEFGDDDYSMKNYTSSGTVSSNEISPILPQLSPASKTGWFGVNEFNIRQGFKFYLNNGSFTIGWKKIDDIWYYFDELGMRVDGLLDIDDEYYYFMEDEYADDTYLTGALITGLYNVPNTGLFYFDEEIDSNGKPGGKAASGFKTINSELYYFRNTEDEISAGKIRSAVKGLAKIGNYYYYFRESNNQISPGSEYTAVKNECITVGKIQYCFDENYRGEKTLTYVNVPTTSMCNDLTYNGSEQTLTKPALAGYTWGDNIATAAGSYQVFATLEEGYSWSDSTTDPKMITCDIKKIKVEKPTLEVSVYKYNGETIDLRINEYDTTRINLTGTFSVIEIGDYSVTAILKNPEITEWEDGTDSSVVLNWKVMKGLRPTPHLYSVSVVYDGEPHTVTIDPVDDGTVYYKTDDTDWSEEKPTRTEVGTTTVYVKVAGSEHFSDSEVITATIEINKSSAKTPIIHDYVGVTDGYSHSITVDPVDDGTLVYRTDDTDWSEIKPTRDSMGDTEIYVKVIGDSNHLDSEIASGHVVLLSYIAVAVSRYGLDNDNNYITKIDANTDSIKYSSYFQLSEGFSINVDTKVVNGKNIVYTGGKTRIMYGSAVYIEYTNIVSGDTNGDGKLNYLDYVNVYNHIQKVKHPDLNKNLLEGIYLIAGDMSNDNKINYLDYVGIYNKIKELKGGAN
jgi:beta-lactamase superfamily II metal-dependent hydrolase